MRSRSSLRILALLATAVAALAAGPTASASSLPWFSGIRALGGTTIEPAVNDSTGTQVFLMTPNGAVTKANAQHASAPLYLVTYPDASTVDASVLNCTPTNCNHAQIPGIKGHDHLVGVRPTGDYNVDWFVLVEFFTGKNPDAMNHRVLTLTQLNALKASGDLVEVNIHFSFNCQIVGAAAYLRGTPLSF